MPEEKSDLLKKILTISLIIGALTPLITFFVDRMDKGNVQEEKINTEKYKELTSPQEKLSSQEVKGESSNGGPEAVGWDSLDLNFEKSDTLILDSNNVINEPQFEIIRKGYVVAEERYLTFENKTFRIYPSDIVSDLEVAFINITDSKMKTIIKSDINVGESIIFERNSKTYKVTLLGVKTRLIRSNLAYFNVERSVDN